MNKEFKYGLAGLGLALVFVLLLKFSSDGISFIASQPKKETDKKDAEYVQPIIFLNKHGKELFHENCDACHCINKTDCELTGIFNRGPDCDTMYEWIRNSTKVIEWGNPYYVQQFKNYNETPMQLFPNLTNEDIDDILEYIDQSRMPHY